MFKYAASVNFHVRVPNEEIPRIINYTFGMHMLGDFMDFVTHCRQWIHSQGWTIEKETYNIVDDQNKYIDDLYMGNIIGHTTL